MSRVERVYTQWRSKGSTWHRIANNENGERLGSDVTSNIAKYQGNCRRRSAKKPQTLCEEASDVRSNFVLNTGSRSKEIKDKIARPKSRRVNDTTLSEHCETRRIGNTWLDKGRESLKSDRLDCG